MVMELTFHGDVKVIGGLPEGCTVFDKVTEAMLGLAGLPGAA